MKVEGNNGTGKGTKGEQKRQERIMVGEGGDRAQKSQSAHTCMKI